MNVEKIRNIALKLVNSYSSDGTVLTDSDIADFKLAFVDNLNTAQNKFAEKDRIEDVLTIIQASSDNGDVLNSLPVELIGINKVIFLNSNNRRKLFNDYSEEAGGIIIPSNYEGTFFVYYYKNPTPLALDTDEPEINSRFHSYLAYFCAGIWLTSTGQQAQGITYLNIFDNFLRECEPNSDTGSGIINVSKW